MKSESELLAKLEKAIDDLNNFCASLKPEESSDNMPHDAQLRMSTTLGLITGLGIAMDMENELRELFAKMKLAGIVKNL